MVLLCFSKVMWDSEHGVLCSIVVQFQVMDAGVRTHCDIHGHYQVKTWITAEI